MLLFGEVFLTLHDQIPMLEYEVRFLLDRHPAAGCGCLGLAALAAPLLLPPALAAPAHGFLHSPHGIQNQRVDVLDDVEDAQLMVSLGPELGDRGGVQVRAVGDHDTRLEPPVLEVLEKPPHVIVIVGCYQGESHRQIAQRISITPARKIRARADTNPTRQRGSAGFSLAGASGWYL